MAARRPDPAARSAQHPRTSACAFRNLIYFHEVDKGGHFAAWEHGGSVREVSFMVKDSKRFPDTDGWGYAQFRYNTASGTFTPYGNGPAFAKADCHQCHISGAKARSFIFTSYAPR